MTAAHWYPESGHARFVHPTDYCSIAPLRDDQQPCLEFSLLLTGADINVRCVQGFCLGRPSARWLLSGTWPYCRHGRPLPRARYRHCVGCARRPRRWTGPCARRCNKNTSAGASVSGAGMRSKSYPAMVSFRKGSLISPLLRRWRRQLCAGHPCPGYCRSGTGSDLSHASSRRY